MELPQSTAYGRIIAKDKLFGRGVANRELQDIVARQIGRVRWANKIAPGTMNISPDGEITEIELIEIELRAPFSELDSRILPLIVKAIPYSLLFELICGDNKSYAVVFGGKTYLSETPPKIIGNGTKSIWENIVRQIAGIPGNDMPLADAIAEVERTDKLTRQIESLERKVMVERQPRRKLEYANELRKLKEFLENG